MMRDKGVSFNVYSLKNLNSSIRLRLKSRFILPAWLSASGQQFCSISFAPFHSPSLRRRSFYIITSRYRVIARDVLLFNGHHGRNRHYSHSALQRHHIFSFTFSFFLFLFPLASYPSYSISFCTHLFVCLLAYFAELISFRSMSGFFFAFVMPCFPFISQVVRPELGSYYDCQTTNYFYVSALGRHALWYERLRVSSLFTSFLAFILLFFIGLDWGANSLNGCVSFAKFCLLTRWQVSRVIFM